MEFLTYGVPVIAIGIMVIYLICKLKGKSGKEERDMSPQTVMADLPDNRGPQRSVMIKSFGDRKLDVIKSVRDHAGLGLQEAKDVVETAGTIRGLPEEAAKALVAELAERGAVAEIV